MAQHTVSDQYALPRPASGYSWRFVRSMSLPEVVIHPFTGDGYRREDGKPWEHDGYRVEASGAVTPASLVRDDTKLKR